jgi:hypothetical protein
MLNIFIISNDKRVEGLTEHLQPFLKTIIRRASDFDQGLKEVFENRPTLVLIQDFIGSVSGETVARHIKSLLGQSSPKIILLSDSAVTGKKIPSSCDNWLQIGDSELQLRDEFAKLIELYFPDEWLEIHREIERSACAETANSDLPESFEAKEVSIALDAGEEAIGAGGELAPTVAGGNQTGKDEESYYIATDSLPEYSSSVDLLNLASVRKKTSRRILPILLLFMLGTGAYYLYTRQGDAPLIKEDGIPARAPKSNIQNTPVPGEKSSNYRAGLPSFIQPGWRDQEFSTKLPGWERYVSNECEFRIFRENGKIGAIQTLALNGMSLRNSLVTDVLKGFGYTGQLQPASVTTKDGFKVEKTIIRDIGELEVYSKSQQIKAFVLEFN